MTKREWQIFFGLKVKEIGGYIKQKLKIIIPIISALLFFAVITYLMLYSNISFLNWYTKEIGFNMVALRQNFPIAMLAIILAIVFTLGGFLMWVASFLLIPLIIIFSIIKNEELTKLFKIFWGIVLIIFQGLSFFISHLINVNGSSSYIQIVPIEALAFQLFGGIILCLIGIGIYNFVEWIKSNLELTKEIYEKEIKAQKRKKK